MLSQVVGQIWESFDVTRLIQEAKMTIFKWIKFMEVLTSLSKKTLKEIQARRESGTGQGAT